MIGKKFFLYILQLYVIKSREGRKFKKKKLHFWTKIVNFGIGKFRTFFQKNKPRNNQDQISKDKKIEKSPVSMKSHFWIKIEDNLKIMILADIFSKKIKKKISQVQSQKSPC